MLTFILSLDFKNWRYDLFQEICSILHFGLVGETWALKLE